MGAELVDLLLEVGVIGGESLGGKPETLRADVVPIEAALEIAGNGREAAAPVGLLPGQAVQGRRLDPALPCRRDPGLDRGPVRRLQPGELAGAERGEPGQHPLLGVILITRSVFLGNQGRDRAGHRDGGAHRDTSGAGASGSSAHFDSRPSEDFR